jgi:hypothetical protein
MGRGKRVSAFVEVASPAGRVSAGSSVKLPLMAAWIRSPQLRSASSGIPHGRGVSNGAKRNYTITDATKARTLFNNTLAWIRCSAPLNPPSRSVREHLISEFGGHFAHDSRDIERIDALNCPKVAV